MPRPLIFGNGRLLVLFDSRGRMRDLVWPMSIGRNHLAGSYCRLGVWLNGRFSWLDAREWQISQSFEGANGVESFISPAHPIALVISTWISDSDSLHRALEIQSVGDFEGPVRIFFSHDFSIDESPVGDTVFYHAASMSVVHHKRSVALAFGAMGPNGGIGRVACGLKRVAGFEGTFRDAEDGELHEKLIEQGSVDSTFYVEVDLVPGKPLEIEYWLCAGSTIQEATRSAMARRSVDRPNPAPERLPTGFDVLPTPIRTLAQRSIGVLRALTADNGAILAACDSDIMVDNLSHYSYVWPRDGAIVANAFDRLEDHEYSARYFNFCKALISDQQPYFFQKYNADGTVGANWLPWQVGGEPVLPLQEDETALTLWAYGQHHELAGVEPCESYADFVRPMAEFVASYVDPSTNLPLPSHDLWEERRGVHAFTACSVVAGLRSAAKIATQVGELEDSSRYSSAADAIIASIRSELVDKSTGGLRRSISPDGVVDPIADAASLLGFFIGGIQDRDLLERTTEQIHAALWVGDGIGGVARYSGDWYCRRHDHLPGNPWVICTLWLARAKINLANTISELEAALDLLNWVVDRADSAGALAEQYDPLTGEPLSVSPLAWSHAEFLHSCLDWIDKRAALARAPQK